MSQKNQVIENLLSRASTDRLVAPAPQGDVLSRILSTALRAPDHGRMRPWRYVVVTGEHRAPYADLVAKSMLEVDPEVSPKKVEKRRERYATVPMTIVLGMDITPEAKISEEEQVMAAAGGAMNILNALHAEGFGGIWLSGYYQNHRPFRKALGFGKTQRIAGFLLVGSVEGDAPRAKRPPIEDYYALWDGTPVTFGVDE